MRALAVFLCIALAGCATTDTTGFTKDERKQAAIEDAKTRTAWTLFGITVLTKAVEAGAAAWSNGGERKLPNDFSK
jgi:hypothetical protein